MVHLHAISGFPMLNGTWHTSCMTQDNKIHDMVAPVLRLVLLGDSDNTLVNAASVYELPECSLQCGDIPVNLTEAVWGVREMDVCSTFLQLSECWVFARVVGKYPFISEF